MKSANVLKILHVSRQTLVKYVKSKEVRVVPLPNGTYEYNDDDVYRKAGLANERMNVVYARVSTAKKKRFGKPASNTGFVLQQEWNTRFQIIQRCGKWNEFRQEELQNTS